MNDADRTDDAFMALALHEARRADYRTSPNPSVGCVVVRDGTVVASGYHERAGEPHAEVIALRNAGSAASGSTLYITLEPCTHQGRTPPCVDAVIAAAPARVVCAMEDPNPGERGRGLRRLREAGIEVTLGVRKTEAERLNEFYVHHARTARPFVTAKIAASLDGRVATAGGDSRWITSEESRQLAHRLRHEHDAVMVGAGTVIADDPRLDARFDGARRPLRVVLDSTMRVPLDATLFLNDPESVLVATTHRAAPDRVRQLRDIGVTVQEFPESSNGVDLEAVLSALGERPLLSVLIEGGPSLLGSAFDAAAVQRVVAMLSPRVLGGEQAPAAVGGLGAPRLNEVPLLADVQVERCGPDIVVSGYCVARDM